MVLAQMADPSQDSSDAAAASHCSRQVTSEHGRTACCGLARASGDLINCFCFFLGYYLLFYRVVITRACFPAGLDH